MAKKNKTVRYVDIARDAGVANSVVSSLFSGNYYENRKGAVVGIGKETQKRIWKSCRKLGFRPANPTLFMEIYPEEADVIFLLNRASGGFAANFYSMILHGLVDEAEQHDANMVLGWFDENVDYCVESDQALRAVKRNPTGKFILAGKPNYSLVLSLLGKGAKVVYVARYLEVPGLVSVMPDYRQAAKLAIDHLHQLGHRNIGVAGGYHFLEQGYNTMELVQGSAEAFEEYDQSFTFKDVIDLEPMEKNPAAFKKLFMGKNRLSAVFCLDDAIALVVSRLAGSVGLRIPDDISVIGCNDDRLGKGLDRQFTTVHFPMYELGKAAFKEITKCAIEGPPKEAVKQTWPVNLVERSTVAPISR